MAAPLIFRSRIGGVWFTIVFGAAAVAFFNWLHAPPVTLLEGVDNAPSWRLLVLIGYVMIVAMAVAASRRRVVVDEAGLTRHWLLWTRRIAWDEIREVALPRWGRFWWKGVALELDRPTRGFWTLRPGPPTKELVLDGLRDFEGLVREIVARAPQATVSDGVRAYLAAPREVLWRYRLPALLSLGALAGIVAVAMARTMANGWPGMGLVFAAIAAGPGLPLLCGWALNREWPWKGALLAATAVLFYCLQPALLPALMFGMAAPLLLTLAVCLGWTVATLVVCLPCRPRWPLVVVGYALALAAAVLPTWRYVTDEVLPFGETVPLDGTAMWTAWAPDGSALCVSAWTGEGEEGLYHVVDTASLEVRTFRFRSWPLVCWMPSPDRVLYRAWRDEEAGRPVCVLWAVDVRSGDQTRVLAAPEISLPLEEYASPAGQTLAVLAGPEGAPAVHLVRTDDLSVRRLKLKGGPERIDSVRGRGDGELVLVEGPRGASRDDNRPQTVTFWACSADDPRPARLYGKTGPLVWWSIPRQARWALVGIGPRHDTVERHELVDLATGRARPIELPGRPQVAPGRWLRDGQTFAYVHREGDTTFLMTVDAASGKVDRLYATEEELSAWQVALSADARYVACLVARDASCRVRIVDLATGQATTLRQFLPKHARWIGPRWSPTEPLLAIFRDQALRLFRFPAQP